MKRLFAAVAALGLAGSVAGGPTLLSAQSAPSWATFHGNMQRTGASPLSGPLTNAAANKWDLHHAVNSSPAIDATNTAYVGANDGYVYALSPADPATYKWRFKTGAVAGSPTLSSNGATLYVASSDGNVFAVKTADGTQIWTQNAGGGVDGAPALSSDGSTVYIAIENGSIKPLNASTGALGKAFPVNGTIKGSPALGTDGTIYVGTHSAALYGQPGGGGNLVGYYPTGPVESTAAVDSTGSIYVTTDYGTLDAFTAGTPNARWSFPVANHLAALSSPAVSNGVVYFGDTNNNVYAVNANTGQQVWIASTGGPVKSSPAVAAGNGIVYVGSDDGNIYALRTSDGSQLWSKNTGAAVSSSPGIGPDGSVWVGSQSGTVYRIHDVSPPGNPGTPVPKTTSTVRPGPSSTPSASGLSLSLLPQVKGGARQTITVTAPANTVVHLRINYPNGDHQSGKITVGPAGAALYSYVQGLSKIKTNRKYARVQARTDAGATALAQYKILYGSIDASVEPRSGKPGKTLSIWIHTKKATKVTASLTFPRHQHKNMSAKTASNGWAHILYKIGRNLGKGKVLVQAQRSNGKGPSTKTTFTLK